MADSATTVTQEMSSVKMTGDWDDQRANWTYDLMLWTLSILVDLFFRVVHPRGSWKIPRTGPVIFVAAPHANQFVDPLILMRVVRQEAKRRFAILTAEKSMKRKFIGLMSRLSGAVPVGRALDTTKSMPGRVYLPDPDNDPTLLRGVGTNFEAPDFQIGGLVVLPVVDNVTANTEIAEIKGPEEMRLKKPFKSAIALYQLTGRNIEEEKKDAINVHANGLANSHTNGLSNGHSQPKANIGKNFEGTTFKVAPKIDQTKVYDAVFGRLQAGGCVTIFPEGGSHDRTELLPLKAGVAIMALGAVAADPTCTLKIVPCGMNYFHAHKFRSRAVIEFGSPIDIPAELVEEYKTGSRRDAVSKMLSIIYDALVAVTVTSPDYDTLMLIQAVRRLYNPKGKKLPLPMVVELNRRLVKGYTRYKDDPRIIQLKKNVINYNQELLALNVRDHQLEYAKLSIAQVVLTLFYRIAKLAVLSAGVLPGLVLFAPVFIAGKVISIRKSAEALAASTVKIQARDVLATWKLLVAMALAPALYTFYTVLLVWWNYYNGVGGRMPENVPLWAVVIFAYVFFPAVTFAALRFGEIGMDIFKSIRPLVLALNPASGNTLVKLRKTRAELAAEVTNLINELGPEMFPDFDAHRMMSGSNTPPRTPGGRVRSWSEVFSMKSRNGSPDRSSNASASIGGRPSHAGHLPRNESFKNLGNIGLFASRPQTPSSGHSRSRSGSRKPSSRRRFGNTGGFSTIDSKEALDDVSQKIRGAMRERRRRRASDDVDDESDYSSGISTPGSDEVVLKKSS